MVEQKVHAQTLRRAGLDWTLSGEGAIWTGSRKQCHGLPLVVFLTQPGVCALVGLCVDMLQLGSYTGRPGRPLYVLSCWAYEAKRPLLLYKLK